MSSHRPRIPKDKATPSSKEPNMPDKSKSSSKTVTYSELPEWQKDNEYIVYGYRRVQHHWKGCLESVFAYLHNESVNIHSHLWGGVLFVYFLATVHPAQLTTYRTTWMDHVMFAIFFASASFCLFSSALFHTSNCHSREVCRRCHAFDYVGIMVLNLGSHYPLLYYGFFCETQFQIVYILAITLANGAAAFIVLDEEYSKPTHRGARTAIFLALGLASAIPVCHWLLVHGVQKTLVDMGVQWFLLSGSFYIGGSLLYVNRIPERFSPGTFDYFFHSHQIFHACVVCGAYLHYVFISVALDHSYSQSECVVGRSSVP